MIVYRNEKQRIISESLGFNGSGSENLKNFSRAYSTTDRPGPKGFQEWLSFSFDNSNHSCPVKVYIIHLIRHSKHNNINMLAYKSHYLDKNWNKWDKNHRGIGRSEPVNMGGHWIGKRSDLRQEDRPTYNHILICICDYIKLDYTNIISLIYCNLDHAN